MIALAYCCVLCLGEAQNLPWLDIDFERQLWVVRKPGDEVVESWTPKDKDMRLVPIPSEALSVLAEAQLEAADGQRYVFVIGKGASAGGRAKRQNFPRDFQASRRQAGVPKCTFHDSRKSYRTNLAGKVPLHVVQELARHADIAPRRRSVGRHCRAQPSASVVHGPPGSTRGGTTASSPSLPMRRRRLSSRRPTL